MKTNSEAFQEAQEVFPGGVNSPVRAFKAVGGHPLFIARGDGAWIEDIEGKKLIDYVGSWGPLILGHARPEVVQAITFAAATGTTFGAPTLGETALAKRVQRAFPSMEKMRLVSSGTEATMAAIRLARGYSKRDILIKFDGCYHGHADPLLVSAGSGVATLGIPGCPGVPESTAANTLTARFNDLEGVKALFHAHPKKIAAIIVEPVAGNMGVVLPQPGFLDGLMSLARQEGSLVIFDEVMTGFRAGFHGVQRECREIPDLTCLGKIVGGGMPLAIYGGRKEIMASVAPEGPVYQAGTLSGNPLAVAAGNATLQILEHAHQEYELLTQRTSELCRGLAELARQRGIKSCINQYGSMFTAFFCPGPINDFRDARRADAERFARFFCGMLAEGVYLAPSQFEAAFVSMAHGAAEIQKTLEGAEKVFSQLVRS